jgi:hypothetical protein
MRPSGNVLARHVPRDRFKPRGQCTHLARPEIQGLADDRLFNRLLRDRVRGDKRAREQNESENPTPQRHLDSSRHDRESTAFALIAPRGQGVLAGVTDY